MMLVRRNSQAGIRIAPTSSLWRLHTISYRNHRKITVIDGAIGYTGVRVFLYEKGYLHAKTISIDSEICSIGSANIDIRSFSINYELNAVLYSRALAKELEEAFERDLAHCIEFDPKEYEHRSIASRFRDSVARLLSPLL
jgi:cardiolipin synthase